MPDRSNPRGDRIRRTAVWLGPVVCALFLATLEIEPDQPLITRTAAVAVLMAVWWITEAVPLAATALLPVVLFPVLGIMDGKQVAQHYFTDISLLYVGGFLVALAMQRWDLHRRIALRILRTIGTSPARLILGFMVSTAFLSMWISNTASTMMMVTIALAVLSQLESSRDPQSVAPLAKSLLLGVAYSASIGGVATLVGTPTNLSFARIYAIQFPTAVEVTFTRWLLFAAPISLALLLLAWATISWRTRRQGQMTAAAGGMIQQQLAALGPIRWAEGVVLATFGGLVLAWIFRKGFAIGDFRLPGWSTGFIEPSFLNDGTVAMAFALLLFVLPARDGTGCRILDWQTASRLPWDIVLLFGGGFALASGFVESGLSAWMGEQLSVFRGANPYLLLAIICFCMTFVTELTSNVATTEMVLPTLAAMSLAIRVDPLFLMVPATISCSCAFMMPVATPPNAIVFGAQRLTIPDMARAGLVLNLLGVIVVVAATYLLGGPLLGIQ